MRVSRATAALLLGGGPRLRFCRTFPATKLGLTNPPARERMRRAAWGGGGRRKRIVLRGPSAQYVRDAMRVVREGAHSEKVDHRPSCTRSDEGDADALSIRAC